VVLYINMDFVATVTLVTSYPEPIFVNVYGAQEWIPENRFASLCRLAGLYVNCCLSGPPDWELITGLLKSRWVVLMRGYPEGPKGPIDP
jgi:hypothetical protein